MKTVLPVLPEGTRERIRLAREAFDRTMEAPLIEVEKHLVKSGDAICCPDGVWRPVLASFGENMASATATLWVVMAYADWDADATQRMAGSPSEPTLVRRVA